MSKFLIHIHSGPDLKNKATLGMLVAVTAFNKGNEVNVFLAADGVHLLNVKKEGEVVGQGTGELKNHLDVFKKAGMLRRVLTRIWNKEGEARVGILFEYKDEAYSLFVYLIKLIRQLVIYELLNIKPI